MKTCRLCKNIINTKPYLELNHLPEKVQNFTPMGQKNKSRTINLKVYQCPYCGLVQVLQKNVDYYRDVIRAVAVSESMKDFRKTYFKNFIEKCDLQGKRIVEIGSGCGEYLELAKICGIEADFYGLEHLNTSVRTAVEKGLNVYEGFIENENSRIPGAPYDAFFIMNFLEHIPNACEFLVGIANNLVGNGYGLVEVPNGNLILQKNMYSEFMLEHLSYFTKDTLRLMLELSGFEVISCEVIWHDYIISAIVKKRCQIKPDAMLAAKEKELSKLKKIVSECKEENENVAVWGAGHQALHLMAMADFTKTDIKCVIDSASFKQNRLTPVTNIPIFSPQALLTEKIDFVIIMAGSYSEEVQNILKEKYTDIKSIVF